MIVGVLIGVYAVRLGSFRVLGIEADPFMQEDGVRKAFGGAQWDGVSIRTPTPARLAGVP